MGAKSARKPQPRLGRRATLVVAAAGVAAGGFLHGFLPTADTSSHAATTDGPARCVVIQVPR